MPVKSPRVRGVEGYAIYDARSFFGRKEQVDFRAFGISYGPKKVIVLPTLKPRIDYPGTITKRSAGEDVLYLVGKHIFAGAGNIGYDDLKLDGNVEHVLAVLSSGELWKWPLSYWFETKVEGNNIVPTAKEQFALVLPNFAYTFSGNPERLPDRLALFLPFNSIYRRPKNAQTYRIA